MDSLTELLDAIDEGINEVVDGVKDTVCARYVLYFDSDFL